MRASRRYACSPRAIPRRSPRACVAGSSARSACSPAPAPALESSGRYCHGIVEHANQHPAGEGTDRRRMYLTLEITGADAARFGSQRIHTFGVEGGRIGRAADNQWVIPDQYIHSLHAVVRYMSGLFFIEKRGQNRVAVNRADIDLPLNEPFPLKDGDKLYLDDYELSVRVSRTPPSIAPAPPPSVDLAALDPKIGRA